MDLGFLSEYSHVALGRNILSKQNNSLSVTLILSAVDKMACHPTSGSRIFSPQNRTPVKPFFLIVAGMKLIYNVVLVSGG